MENEHGSEDGCNEWTDEYWDCLKTEEIKTEIVIFSNDLEIPLPETPPPFTAEIKYSEYSGYSVVGRFPGISANAEQLSCTRKHCRSNRNR